MPMSPRTNFHCETKGLHVLLGEIQQCSFVAFMYLCLMQFLLQ